MSTFILAKTNLVEKSQNKTENIERQDETPQNFEILSNFQGSNFDRKLKLSRVA